MAAGAQVERVAVAVEVAAQADSAVVPEEREVKVATARMAAASVASVALAAAAVAAQGKRTRRQTEYPP